MRIILFLFLFISFHSFSEINRVRFYQAIQSGSLKQVTEEINSLSKNKASINKDAFLGAMIMKKAQFMKTPKEKLTVFKKGRDLLESAIKKNPNNAEFRFLRLLIQENCPKILKYNTNREEDAELIQQKINTLPKVTQKQVRNYALRSHYLTL